MVAFTIPSTALVLSLLSVLADSIAATPLPKIPNVCQAGFCYHTGAAFSPALVAAQAVQARRQQTQPRLVKRDPANGAFTMPFLSPQVRGVMAKAIAKAKAMRKGSQGS